MNAKHFQFLLLFNSEKLVDMVPESGRVFVKVLVFVLLTLSCLMLKAAPLYVQQLLLQQLQRQPLYQQLGLIGKNGVFVTPLAAEVIATGIENAKVTATVTFILRVMEILTV